MKTIKKFMTLSCAAMLALTFSGCGSSEQGAGKVYFVSHTEATAFTGKILDGVTARASGLGLTVEFMNANRDANLQVDHMNEAIAAHPAAIILSAVDAAVLAPSVEKANEAGIPVIATSRDLYGGQFAMVKSDERQAGKLQGEYMAKHLPTNAKIVYLMGESGQSSTEERWAGFKEACLDTRKDITLLAKADGSWSEAEAIKYMTLWLQIFPQIDGVVAANDTMALGAASAIKASGRTGILVSGVDAKEAALKALATGEMSQTVKQDADKTAAAISELLQKVTAGQTPTENVKVPFTEVTRDSVK